MCTDAFRFSQSVEFAKNAWVCFMRQTDKFAKNAWHQEKSVIYCILRKIRACSSAGRALRSQRRGRGFDPLQVHHVRAKCVWLCFRHMAKTSVHSLALPSPQKADGFSGTPEVLTEKVRISKHLLHRNNEMILLQVRSSRYFMRFSAVWKASIFDGKSFTVKYLFCELEPQS